MPDDIAEYNYNQFKLHMNTMGYFGYSQDNTPVPWTLANSTLDFYNTYCYQFPPGGTDLNNIYGYSIRNGQYFGLPQHTDFIYYAYVPPYIILPSADAQQYTFAYKNLPIPVPAFIRIYDRMIGGTEIVDIGQFYDSEFQIIYEPNITVYCYSSEEAYYNDTQLEHPEQTITYQPLEWERTLELPRPYNYFLIQVTHNGNTSSVGLKYNAEGITVLKPNIFSEIVSAPYSNKTFSDDEIIVVPLFINFDIVAQQADPATHATLHVAAPHCSITVRYTDRNKVRQQITVTNTTQDLESLLDTSYSWSAIPESGEYTLSDTAGGGIVNNPDISIAPVVSHTGVYVRFHFISLYCTSGSLDYIATNGAPAQMAIHNNSRPLIKRGTQYSWTVNADTGYQGISNPSSPQQANNTQTIVIDAQPVLYTITAVRSANVQSIFLRYYNQNNIQTEAMINSPTPSGSYTALFNTPYHWEATAMTDYTIIPPITPFDGTITGNLGIAPQALHNRTIQVRPGAHVTLQVTYTNRSYQQTTTPDLTTNTNLATLQTTDYSWTATADTNWHLTGPSYGSDTVKDDDVQLVVQAERDVTTITVRLNTGVASIILNYTDNLGAAIRRIFTQTKSVPAAKGTYYSWEATNKIGYRLNTDRGEGYADNTEISPTTYAIKGVQFNRKDDSVPSQTLVGINGTWYTIPCFVELANDNTPFTIYREDGTTESVSGYANKNDIITISRNSAAEKYMGRVTRGSGETSATDTFYMPSSYSLAPTGRVNWPITQGGGSSDTLTVTQHDLWTSITVTISGSGGPGSEADVYFFPVYQYQFTRS